MIKWIEREFIDEIRKNFFFFFFFYRMVENFLFEA